MHYYLLSISNLSTGAQDCFTLLDYDSQNLIYPLDCKFNRQMSQHYKEIPWIEFWKYNSCHDKNTNDEDKIFFIHLNGDTSNFNDFLIKKYIALFLILFKSYMFFRIVLPRGNIF